MPRTRWDAFCSFLCSFFFPFDGWAWLGCSWARVPRTKYGPARFFFPSSPFGWVWVGCWWASAPGTRWGQFACICSLCSRNGTCNPACPVGVVWGVVGRRASQDWGCAAWWSWGLGLGGSWPGGVVLKGAVCCPALQVKVYLADFPPLLSSACRSRCTSPTRGPLSKDTERYCVPGCHPLAGQGVPRRLLACHRRLLPLPLHRQRPGLPLL